MGTENAEYVAEVVRHAAVGFQYAKALADPVFGESFRKPDGWNSLLKHNIPSLKIDSLFKEDSKNTWTRATLQALFVACWIHQPSEKGSYLIELTQAQHLVADFEYNRLVASGELENRKPFSTKPVLSKLPIPASSHLSGKGASAGKGWNFLQGYSELLVQANLGKTYEQLLDTSKTITNQLFLKCEGHTPNNLSGMFNHLRSYIHKKKHGVGLTASESLNRWAKISNLVEGRVAENFSKEYEELLKQLFPFEKKISKKTTVEMAVKELCKRTGKAFQAEHARSNSRLGEAMLGPQGYLAFFLTQQSPLMTHDRVNYSRAVDKELQEIAEWMADQKPDSQEQYFMEVRATPEQLNQSLHSFSRTLNSQHVIRL